MRSVAGRRRDSTLSAAWVRTGVVGVGVSCPAARGVEPLESMLWLEELAVDELPGVSAAVPLRWPLLMVKRREMPLAPAGITISDSGPSGYGCIDRAADAPGPALVSPLTQCLLSPHRMRSGQACRPDGRVS